MTANMMRFVEDSSGATAVEYAALAAGIALAIALVVSQLGDGVNALYMSVGGAFPN